jgi:hypothetical protein
MPRPKLFLFLILLGIGMALLAWSFRNNVFTNERALSMLTGIITTLIILSLTELIPEFARWTGTFSRRGQFRVLFGEYAFRDDARLVFAYRYIDKDRINEDPFSTWQKVPSQIRPVPEGVVNWLAFQDIRAAVYVSNTFGEMTGRKTVALHDKDVFGDQKNYCIVSFGLGFTAFTHYVVGLFNSSLFKIEWEPSPKLNHIFTDTFKISGKTPFIPDGDDIALVARIVPPGKYEQEDPRVWFICAGRSASGTAAAGYFLAYRWPEINALYKEFKKDLSKDSVVMALHHREYQGELNNEFAYEYDETVKILKYQEKPVINWARTTS